MGAGNVDQRANVIQNPFRGGPDGCSVLAERASNGSNCTVFSVGSSVPRVDDRRVVSGIVYVIKRGLQWTDASRDYGPHKTPYNRFIRWSRMGVFDRIFVGLADEGPLRQPKNQAQTPD